MAAVTDQGVTYRYNPEGKRVATVSGSAVSAEYLYDMAGSLVTTVNGQGQMVRTILRDNGGVHWGDSIGAAGAGGLRTEFWLVNQVGTLVANGDTQGNFVEGCLSGPFGDGQDCTPGYDFTETHFADKLRDSETDNDYFGARYFNSTMGRFTSPDWAAKAEPVLYAKLDNPQSLNLYSYTENNPLSKADKDGHDPDSIATALMAAANAFGSDNLLGSGRVMQTTAAGQLGAAVGDFAAAVQGASQVVVGTGGNLLGGALDATGVGVFAGVPLNVVSTAATAEGVEAAATGVVNLMRAGNFNSSTREGAIKNNAEKNGGTNKCEQCGGDVQRVGNQKAQPPPGDQLQVHHDPAIKDGGGRDSKPVVVCRSCHLDIHKPQ